MYYFLRFNVHFPGEPGLAGVYWSKGWWRWWWQLDYWSCKSCKVSKVSELQSNHHHQQTNIQFFYRPDALPVTQPTVSKHWSSITYYYVRKLSFSVRIVVVLQSCDTVDLMTGWSKISPPVPKGSSFRVLPGTDLTWSDRQKSRPVKQNRFVSPSQGKP